MATLTVTRGYNAPDGWISGETVTPAKLNSAQSPTVALTAGTIVDADVSASAAVALSKLATGALPTAITVTTANITDDSVTASKLDGVASINQQTTDYTLVLGDAGRVIEVNSSSNRTVTIPPNSSVAFSTGATIVVTRRGTGEVTIAAGSGVTARSADSRLKIGKQYAAAACVKIGSDEWLVVGNLKA